MGQSTIDENHETEDPVELALSTNSSCETDIGTARENFVHQSIPALTLRLRQFASDRDWDRYHTPRNLMLALVGELGELAEIFQFKGDSEDEQLSMEEMDKVRQELADVTIYLIRLADVCGVSLRDAWNELKNGTTKLNEF